MKLLTYLIIVVVSAFIGYKIAQRKILSAAIPENIMPIVAEIRIQINAIENKLATSLTAQEKADLQLQKEKLVKLLSQFQ